MLLIFKWQSCSMLWQNCWSMIMLWMVKRQSCCILLQCDDVLKGPRTELLFCTEMITVHVSTDCSLNLYIGNCVSLPVLFFVSLFCLSRITTPAVELVTWLVYFVLHIITTYLLWANLHREYARLWTPFTLGPNFIGSTHVCGLHSHCEPHTWFCVFAVCYLSIMVHIHLWCGM